MKEQITEELKHESKNLRKKLEDSQQPICG